MPYKKVAAWRGMLPVLVARERFLALAYEDVMARNLSKSDLRRYYEAGTWPPPDYEAATGSLHTERRAVLLRNLSLSFALATLVGLLVLAGFATLGQGSALTLGKVLGALGALLIAWATMLLFFKVPETINGETLIERLPVAFAMLIFVPGAVLAVLGGVL